MSFPSVARDLLLIVFDKNSPSADVLRCAQHDRKTPVFSKLLVLRRSSREYRGLAAWGGDAPTNGDPAVWGRRLVQLGNEGNHQHEAHTGVKMTLSFEVACGSHRTDFARFFRFRLNRTPGYHCSPRQEPSFSGDSEAAISRRRLGRERRAWKPNENHLQAHRRGHCCDGDALRFANGRDGHDL